MKAQFASVDSVGIYKFPRGTYLITNSAWMPGDPPIGEVELRSTEPALVNLPPVFPPRFAWSSRKKRAGTKDPSGFAYWLSPNNPGDVGGAFIDDDVNPKLEICRPEVIDSWIDRSPLWAVHRGTGEPLTRRDLGVFEYRLDRGAGDTQRLPQFNRAVGSPFPHLNSWEAPDEYHLLRTFSRAARAGLAGDRLSRAHAIMTAEDVMLAYQMQEVPQTSDWIPLSLARLKRDARAAPGRGCRIQRGLAWSLLSVVRALQLCRGLPQAERYRTWIASMVTYVEAAQLVNGAFCSFSHGYGMDQDEPWDMYGMDVNESEAPSWQMPFLIFALHEASREVPEVTRRVVGILTKCAKIWRVVSKVPDMYGGAPGLPLYLSVARFGAPHQKIVTGVGPARSMYDVHAFRAFEAYGIPYEVQA
ncbi:hypothetical protein [Caudoviricetes sp.]|nr:hypothetical protein [Caudoviricetes sp.]UOF82780.1 hypothetical protein [Caudoviricetes sp.]